MHSNYGGGVSEMQQFMMDGCPPSLFSISTSPPPPPPPQNSNSGASEVQKFHPLQHHLQQPPPMPQHFAHFGQPIPITQQLFQQSHHHHAHHHHQLQLFQQHQQQHMGLDQESGPENSNSPARMMGGGGGGPSFLAAMNFKLGVNESSGGGGGGGGSRDGINEDEGILQGDDDGSESGLRHHHHHHHQQHRQPWHREEESAANIKEPFWRPLDIDFINPNNKRPAKDKQPAAATTAEISSSSSIKHFKKSNDVGASAAATDSNYKLFSELEAIYKPGGGGGGGVGGGGGETNNNQTGSGSALTGDDNPLVPVTAPGPTAEHGQTDNISDTSNADDAPQKKAQRDDSNSGDAARRKRSRKRRQQKQLSSVATFFESLVKRLMDHQESLHRKFLDVMEKKDQERSAREEACRKQEAAKANREAAARAQERALAATREAAIISFLEKISGESLNLPAKAQFHSQFTEESHQLKDNSAAEDTAVEIYNADSAAANNNNNNNSSSGGGLMQFSSSRWPKAEVQALIRVRSGFEAKFQEPGLKGPLWEEVSLAMAAMGYQRSAKRCKEKWENINKYFRKTKDSGKKRPQHSKTCPYFHLLDQLYSKTPSLSTNASHGRREKNSELLDAIVVPNEAKGNEEEGQGESQDQEENADADADADGDRSPARTERNQEHNSGDRRLLNRLNS